MCCAISHISMNCSTWLSVRVDELIFHDFPIALPCEIFGAVLCIEELMPLLDFKGHNKNENIQTIAGRLCAAKLLKNLGAKQLTVEKHMDGSPIWPLGIFGSISHTDEVACSVLAFSRVGCSGLGIDVEKILPSYAISAVVKTCLTRAERNDCLDSKNISAFATVIFSIKESFYKAISRKVGRVVEFAEISVVDLCWCRGTARIIPISQDLLAWHTDNVHFSCGNEFVFSLVIV